MSAGVRELFRAGRGEGSAARDENRHGQVQRQHAHERTHAEHGLAETSVGIEQRARIRQRVPPSFAAAAATAATDQTGAGGFGVI